MVWGCTESHMKHFVSGALPSLLETFATLCNWTLLMRGVELIYGKRFRANRPAAGIGRRNSLHPFRHSFQLSCKKHLVSSKPNCWVPCAGKGWRQLEAKCSVLGCSCVILSISGISQHAANTAQLGIFRLFFTVGRQGGRRVNAFHRDTWILIMSVLGKVFQVQAKTREGKAPAEKEPVACTAGACGSSPWPFVS